MKLTKKNTISLIYFLFLWVIIGSVSWELFERLLSIIGLNISLSTGKLGFDLSVISFYLKINPGSLFGLLIGLFLFKTL